MFIKKSKVISFIVSLCLLLTLTSFLPGNTCFAAAELKLDKTKVIIDDGEYYSVYGQNMIKTLTGSADITGAKSSNTSVASIKSWGSNYVEVKPVGVGSTTLTITGKNAASKTIPVTVTEQWAQDILNNNIYMAYNWYGTKKIEIIAFVKGTGKLKVGSDTYKFTASGVYDDYPIIKLKKRYNPKTKITLTFTDENGVTITKTAKITASTYPYEINAKSKTVKVTIYNAHKSDKVYLKYKGKTYTKKVSKDKDQKLTTLSFKVKKTVTKSATMKIKILTSKKKTLMSYQSFTLRDYHWDEDMDIYDDY